MGIFPTSGADPVHATDDGVPANSEADADVAGAVAGEPKGSGFVGALWGPVRHLRFPAVTSAETQAQQTKALFGFQAA